MIPLCWILDHTIKDTHTETQARQQRETGAANAAVQLLEFCQEMPCCALRAFYSVVQMLLVSFLGNERDDTKYMVDCRRKHCMVLAKIMEGKDFYRIMVPQEIGFMKSH